jgi:hypothetical protein
VAHRVPGELRRKSAGDDQRDAVFQIDGFPRVPEESATVQSEWDGIDVVQRSGKRAGLLSVCGIPNDLVFKPARFVYQ